MKTTPNPEMVGGGWGLMKTTPNPEMVGGGWGSARTVVYDVNSGKSSVVNKYFRKYFRK
jgi:hypothetical protein